MRVSQLLVVAGLAAAMGVSATPVFAQRGGGGSSRGGSSSGRSAGGGGAARQAGPRTGGASRGVVTRGYAGPGRVGAGYPRYSGVAPIRFYRPYYTFRPRLSLGYGLWVGYPFAYSYAFYDPFFYPYGYYNPYWYGAYYGYSGGGGGRCDSVGPNGYPLYGCAAANAQPYAGAAAPRAGGQPSSDELQAENSISVQTDQSDTGGLSFEITPNTAELFVDDQRIGTVGQFTPTSQPLGVASGHHRVEVRAPGYQTMSFDVEIIPGQVIPYQGVMER